MAKDLTAGRQTFLDRSSLAPLSCFCHTQRAARQAGTLAFMAPRNAAFDLQTCPLYVEEEEEDMCLESIIDARQLRVKQDILVRCHVLYYAPVVLQVAVLDPRLVSVVMARVRTDLGVRRDAC